MHGIFNSQNVRRLFHIKGPNVGAAIPGHAAHVSKTLLYRTPPPQASPFATMLRAEGACALPYSVIHVL